MRLYQDLFYDEYVSQLCAADHFAALLVRVEQALLHAQAQCEIIPPSAAEKITTILGSFQVDLQALQQAIPQVGNAAAPIVKQITATVRAQDEEAAKYIHLGATSQDIVDTATVLKWQAFFYWLEQELAAIIQSLRDLCERYRTTPMIGRTLMQHARPITFGLKAAYWLQALLQAQSLLPQLKEQVLVIQLGGAVGSRNQYLSQAVQEAFATELGLKFRPAWHTNRMPIAIWCGHLGGLVGSLGKIAEDVILLAQTEVGELAEPAALGRGTSSTMPHKRNPILSIAIVANAKQVPFLVANLLATMPQAHERAAGNWHAEWEPMDCLLELTGGALNRTKKLLAGLEVNEARMLENINLTKGLVFAETVALALARALGKAEGYKIVKNACASAQAQDLHLLDVLQNLTLPLTKQELLDCFKAENAIGYSLEIIDQTLAEK